ncbi:MAG: enoyl-CoA hydratase/isomerase family protein [Candidatus Lokiarchaeota archaeon]|nr:enoyl-CoA hydratase/isomerase family protein [Candidatus Lokiarchaeota archaeon]
MIEDLKFNNIDIEIPKSIIIRGKKIGTIDGNYSIISINRPDQLNALTKETFEEIINFLKNIKFNEEIKCIILRGMKSFTKKPSFSSGLDLKNLPEPDIKPIKPYHKYYSAYFIHKYFNFIENYSKPIIAAIDGYAIGGGFELALCCDIIIASERSLFGFPEIKHGMFPAGGGSQKMHRHIGLGRAIKMLYFGSFYSAKEMFEWGFVSYIV